MKIDATIGLGVKVLKHPVLFTYEMSTQTYSGTLILYLNDDKKDKITFKVTVLPNAFLFHIVHESKQPIKISLKKVVEKMFGENKNIPELIVEVSKPQLFFYYQKAPNEQDQTANKTSKFLIGMGAGIDLNLDGLPMAGSVLKEMKALEFKELLAIYSSDTLTTEEVAYFHENDFLPEKFIPSKGVNISAKLLIDGKQEYLTLGGEKTAVNKDKPSKEKKSEDPTNADGPKAIGGKVSETKKEEVKKLDNSINSMVSWKTIDKKIGPVNLQRIGLGYHEGKVIALFDAGIDTKGLGMQLMGLGVGFNLDWNNLDPDFYITGLGLSYRKDPIEIAGAFMRGESNGITTYSGAALIKLKKITISAIGSYAKVGDLPSLFIYGLLEGNIGGDPTFYVTGIAAGFGYNRTLNIPEIDEVANFPLVKLVMQSEVKPISGAQKLTNVLKELETKDAQGRSAIDIAPGNYWFALGVKFTTYKLLESFALITVNFGSKIEFNILGLSRLSFPEKTIREKMGLAAPVIYIELALKLSYTVGGDVIKIDGLITPESYVLDKNCKLSGGFAFYVWVAGEHAGDFVLSLGGYHPRYSKPAHYPEVPRVALNWRMDDSLVLRGELYFALTPSAIMMGGRWELYFTSEYVKVALILWIDLLLQWAPFYYDISIGLIFRIEAHVPMKFFVIHLNLELRAQLDIWGPDFSGKALLDLGIYSFEMAFGKAARGGVKPLEFNEFLDGFLPKSKEDPTQLDTVSIQPDGGVINVFELDGKVGDEKEKYYVLNPLQASINIDSSVPVTKANLNETEISITDEDYPQLKQIGIKPCGISGSAKPPLASAPKKQNRRAGMAPQKEGVAFTLDVGMRKNGLVDNSFTSVLNEKSYPDSLWGSHAGGSSDQKDSTLKGIPSGINLKPSSAPKVSALKPFDFSQFKENWKKEGVARFMGLASAKETSFDGSLYASSEVIKKRTKIIDEVVHSLFENDSSFMIDPEELTTVYSSTGSDEYFRSKPKNCSVGQVPNRLFAS